MNIRTIFYKTVCCERKLAITTEGKLLSSNSLLTADHQPPTKKVFLE
jgi:hypothetical protein